MTPALCAVHPEVPATATCARCGRFFCAACQGADQPLLCTEWVVLWMDPLGILRSPLDLGAVLKNGMQMLSPVIGKVAVLTLVYSAPLVLFLAWMPPDGGNAMWTSFRMTSLYNLLAGTFCTIACTCLFVGAAEGHRLTMGASLAEASARYGRVISTRIRTSLWTSLFLIALIVPGVWKGITLVFSIEAAVRLRKGDPLEQSANLVRGRWWKVFGLWFCIQAVALTTTGALRLGSELLLETSGPIHSHGSSFRRRMGGRLQRSRRNRLPPRHVLRGGEHRRSAPRADALARTAETTLTPASRNVGQPAAGAAKRTAR